MLAKIPTLTFIFEVSPLPSLIFDLSLGLKCVAFLCSAMTQVIPEKATAHIHTVDGSHGECLHLKSLFTPLDRMTLSFTKHTKKHQASKENKQRHNFQKRLPTASISLSRKLDVPKAHCFPSL